MPSVVESGSCYEFLHPDRVRELLERLRPDSVLHKLLDPGALEAAMSFAPIVLHGYDFRHQSPSISFF